MKMRFLKGDPDVTGGFFSSYFAWLFSTNIFLAPILVHKNHYSNRLECTILLLFCTSWTFLMLLAMQKFDDLSTSERFCLEFLLISLPIVFLFQPIFYYFRKQYIIREISEGTKGKKGNACWLYAETIKNLVVTALAIALAAYAGFALETSANPECFFNEFIRSTIIVASLLGAVNLFFFHLIAWWAVVSGCGPCRCFLKMMCMLPTHLTQDEELELAATPGKTLDKEWEREERGHSQQNEGAGVKYSQDKREPNPVLPVAELQSKENLGSLV